MADVTSSYKQLCRIHHPDISDDPESVELMKRINIAYTIVREKLKREAAFRDRAQCQRPANVRRYGGTDTRAHSAEARRTFAESEKEAYSVLDDYFKLISSFDYSGAYNLLSSHDKRYITRESFIEWRKSVARLYPMREFNITGGFPVATVARSGSKALYAHRFVVAVTEDNLADDDTNSGDVEKLVIQENGAWKVFLGYMSVRELTQTFEERFESKWKRDIENRWEEYYTGLYPEYNMLNLAGMHKAASREMYRHRRFGGSVTFAALSIKAGGLRSAGQEQLLRSAAKTICGTLRETDASAYAGDGVFALLFVGLGGKDADEIITRLVGRIRKNAGTHLGARAEIACEHESFSGKDTIDIGSLNKVLRKFRKKM